MKKIAAFALTFLLLSLTPTIIAAPPAGHCPNIDKAIVALDAAMHDMEVANHDFCGHKAEAMEASRHAIEQLRKAQACARCK